ncbi:MAG: DUF371 domain-containing protein [Candidatus Nezhaarchaeales archaeon]
MVHLKETFYAWGHRNIRAMHRTTLEITKEEHMTPRGDCIVAVRSEKSVSDLGQELKQAIRHNNAKITLLLRTLDVEDVITGFGSEKLPLTSKLSLVCRRSDYICPRTLMIKCDKAAIDVNRELINCLRMGNRLQVTIEVEV